MTHAKAVLIALFLCLSTFPAGAALADTPACKQKGETDAELLKHDLRLRLAGRRGEIDSSSREAVAKVMSQLACAGEATSYENGHALALSIMDAERAWGRDEIAANTVNSWWDRISFDRETRTTTVPDDIRDMAMFVVWSDMARPEMRGASTRALIFLAKALSPDHTVNLLDFQAYLQGGDSSSYDRQKTKFAAWQIMRYLWVSDRFGQDVEAKYSEAQLKHYEKTLMSSLALPKALKGLGLK